MMDKYGVEDVKQQQQDELAKVRKTLLDADSKQLTKEASERRRQLEERERELLEALK